MPLAFNDVLVFIEHKHPIATPRTILVSNKLVLQLDAVLIATHIVGTWLVSYGMLAFTHHTHLYRRPSMAPVPLGLAREGFDEMVEGRRDDQRQTREGKEGIVYMYYTYILSSAPISHSALPLLSFLGCLFNPLIHWNLEAMVNPFW